MTMSTAHRPASLAVVALAVTATFTACAGGPAAAAPQPPAPSAKAAGVALPPLNGQFDYQIGGPYDPVATVKIVDRDRGEAPVGGKYNICYVNAFQTQPEDKKFWTTQHPDLLVKKDGRYVTDPNWPGEYLMDTSTATKRNALAAIVNPWIDGCATSGFQAVEPDNLDSWTRSKKRLKAEHNLAMATLLATRAHDRGLAIAQKNTSEIGTVGKTQVGFDFAIAEECQVYDECGDYIDVYGSQVIEIEYTDNDPAFYTTACAAQGQEIPVILRDRDVVARGQRAYRYQSC